MTLTPAGHALGYVPDGPDPRDFLLPTVDAAHEHVDLTASGLMPEVWDQGQLGSCTAHGVLAAILYAAALVGTPVPMLSRLECYWKARDLEGDTDQDSGAMIRDAVKAAASGLAPETDWPYDVSTYATPPSEQTLTDSVHRALVYHSAERSRAGIQTPLSARLPVIIGVTLWESFESPEALDTGVVHHPEPGEQELGGHCMLAVGIGTGAQWKVDGQFPAAVDDRLYVKVRNSWGPDVYQGGYLLLGAPYLRKHGNDFWVVSVAD
jgi:C1A family cysteine protease